MTEEYEINKRDGDLYADFISDVFYDKYFIQLSHFKSKQYQLKGENKQGIEIKFDNQYEKTGNLYIEVAEKSNAMNLNYYESGIYRKDNTWLYVIGNYKIIYVFSKTILRLIHNWKDTNGDKRYREVETSTSQGYLLPKNIAEIYASLIIIL